MSYKNLEIWKLADELVVEIHEMTLTELQNLKCLKREVRSGDQSKSVKPTIVEGYGRETL
jgi:hypothetical protein